MKVTKVEGAKKGLKKQIISKITCGILFLTMSVSAVGAYKATKKEVPIKVSQGIVLSASRDEDFPKPINYTFAKPDKYGLIQSAVS